VLALAAYAAVAIAYSWPLATHLTTHVTGPITSDTGVYVWNQWVFRHELLEHHRLPYFTDHIFGGARPANLSLHNYTFFQNLLALPLIPALGVVATFNVVYLLMAVLTAWTAFLLAYRLAGRVPEAWLAGMAFAWSPLIVTRGFGHYSVAAAAPLPLFLLLLERTAEHRRVRDAVALGATVWWAGSCDAYYAVYCVIIAALYIATRLVTVRRATATAIARAMRWPLDVLMLSLAGLAVAVVVSGGFDLRLFRRPAHMHSLYTPMLALTTLALIRAALYWRPSFESVTRADVWRFARIASVAGIVAAAMLSPVLYAFGVQLADAQFAPPAVLWRSSPPGVDLLALLLPNPNHPLAPDSFAAWVAGLPNGYLENVASLSLVALGTVGIALRAGWRPPRWWAVLAIASTLLAVGPFLRVAAVNTAIPGPWALLRYLPIVGLARTPARFAVLVTLALAMLFGAALTWLGQRRPESRRRVVAVAGILLAFELLPAPLTLHATTVPSIYQQIAAAPDDVRVLELPFGVRDGTTSVGNFTARTQFFQTVHEKPLIGGYLSRVPPWRRRAMRGNPVLNALMILSEDSPLTTEQARQLEERGRRFLRNRHVGFVVIDRARASAALRETAIRVFDLEQAGEDGGFELYVPR
jgi:hypothetical protein